MRKIYALFLFAALFAACSMPSNDLDNSGGLTPPGNGIQVDPAYWFGGIYRALVAREQDGTMGQIANVQYVIDMINRRWGAGTLTPFPGTEMQIANTEYLLKVIDMANGGRTNFGESSFATKQIVDVIAVNDAVNRLFVPGIKFTAVSGSNIARSNDGINWAWEPFPIAVTNLSNIAFGNGRWVATAGRDMFHSTDAINWSRITIPVDDAINWEIVDFSVDTGLFMAIGNTALAVNPGGTVAWSHNGVDWETINRPFDFSPDGRGGLISVAQSAGRTVTVNRFSSFIFHSADRINWARVTVGMTNYTSIAFGNGRFVAVGSNGSLAATSTDGATWTIINDLSISGLSWNQVHFDNGRWVVVGFGGSIATSTDGINWSREVILPGAGNNSWSRIAFGNGNWIILGPGGTMLHSTNGVNWTPATIEGMSSFNWQNGGVAFGGS